MEEAKYITEVDNIDSEIDFTMGENEMLFRLKMRAEYIKVFAGKKSTLFSIEFWTGWHEWTIPPYDEDNMTEQDIKDWFNANSLSDGIVKDEYPKLWNIDFYGNDVPVHYPGNDPRTEICNAIEEVWDGSDFDIKVESAWKSTNIEGVYTWPDGSVMIYEVTPWNFLYISGTLGDGPIHLDEERQFNTLIIEDDVKSIGANNFSGWKQLIKVTLPEGLKTIGREAFSGCDKIREIRFGRGLESIGEEAFRGCSNLQLVTFPESLRTIEDNVFKDCGNLKVAVMPRSRFVKHGDGAIGEGVKQIDRPYRNSNGALISIGDIRPNEYNDYCGCTVDVHITIYDPDYEYSYSFWLLNHDTGWTGESLMDSIFESELECNPDFDEDMNLGDIYTEEELDEMAWDYIMDGYEFRIEDCPFLDYVRKLDDVIYGMYDAHFEDGGDINDKDIDHLLWRYVDDFWSDLEVEDFVDFDAMAEEKEVNGENWWKKDDYIENLVEDFEKEVLREKTQNGNLSTPETAISYCKEHPADCLLLPYAICKGMLDTHFVKSRKRGRSQRVNSMLQETDWADSAAAEATLLKIRNYLLKGLKESRWVDVDNIHYSRYENCDWIVSEAHDELEALVNTLSLLCPTDATDIKVDRKFELGTDRSADIRRLREECNVVIPEKIAYDFLVDGTMRAEYSAMKLQGESDYDNDRYDKTRLEFIKEDVFPIIEGYLEEEGNGRFFDAARTLKEYDGETFVERLLGTEEEDDYHKEEDDGSLGSRGITYDCYDKSYSVFEKPKELGYMRVEVTGLDDVKHCDTVHIPSSVRYMGQQYTVSCIGEYAFDEREDIKKVTIDSGLTEICENAFRGCTGLCDISLPDSLKVLKPHCFDGCNSLKTIFIPSEVQNIDISCFEGCSRLAEILVDDANRKFMSVDGILCDRESGQRIYVPDANKALDEYEPVPHGPVVEEGDGVFSVDGIRYELTTSCISDKALRVLPSGKDSRYTGIVEIPSRIKYQKRWREVLEIDSYAFSGCPDLIEVRIPDTVRQINHIHYHLDLSGSPRLAAINVDSGNETYVSIDGVVYDKGLTVIVGYPHGHGEHFEIPPKIESIGDSFKNCTVLKSIHIPGRIKNIWDGEFSGCTCLQKVTFGEGIKGIKDGAFAGCISLKEVVFPESIEEVGREAFKGCMALEKIVFPKDRYFDLTGIPEVLLPWGHGPFEMDGVLYWPYCEYKGTDAPLAVYSPDKDAPALAVHPEVEELFIPSVIERNGFTYKVTRSDCAFEQFPNLHVLHLPDTMRDVNLKRIPSLRQVIVSEDNETLASEDGLLFNKDKTLLMGAPRGLRMKRLVIRDGVEIIGTKQGAMSHKDRLLEDIFAGREELEEVILPDSVKVIGEGSFRNCTSLRTVKLGEGLEEIYSRAFSNTALERITLPRSLKYVGQKEFSGPRPFSECSRLAAFEMEGEGELLKVIDGVLYQKTDNGLVLIYCPPAYSGTLTIPEGVVSVGTHACWSCVELEKVEMPDSVRRINSWAFAECAKLEHVNMSRNLRYVGSCAFRECTGLKEADFTVCENYFGHDDFDTSAFQYCDGIKLKLPDSLENMRKYIERDIKHRVTAAELDATDWQ